MLMRLLVDTSADLVSIFTVFTDPYVVKLDLFDSYNLSNENILCDFCIFYDTAEWRTFMLVKYSAVYKIGIYLYSVVRTYWLACMVIVQSVCRSAFIALLQMLPILLHLSVLFGVSCVLDILNIPYIMCDWLVCVYPCCFIARFSVFCVRVLWALIMWRLAYSNIVIWQSQRPSNDMSNVDTSYIIYDFVLTATDDDNFRTRQLIIVTALFIFFTLTMCFDFDFLTSQVVHWGA